MRNKKWPSAAVLTLFSGVASGAPNMEPGLWEITSQMEVSSMPVRMPAVTFTQCMTEQDSVPKGQQTAECNLENVENDGDTVSWEVRCDTPRGTSRGQGEVTYDGDTFTGRFMMTVDSPQGQMEMANTMTGKRIGPCP